MTWAAGDRVKTKYTAAAAKRECPFETGGGPETLRAAIQRLSDEAEQAVRQGKSEIFLTDENVGPDRVAIAGVLAAAAVHTHLVRKGLRSYASVNIRTAERSEEHTSELQSLMRISYAVFCLKKKNTETQTPNINNN